MNDQCNLCQAKGTLHHILNNCDKMLYRYLWRHNSILRSLLMSIKPDLLDGQQVFADLEGETINGGTIPPTVIPTQQKPDLCFIDSNKKDIILIELTVPFEHGRTGTVLPGGLRPFARMSSVIQTTMCAKRDVLCGVGPGPA